MPVTTITLNIDNTILPQAVAALNAKVGYSATLPDGTANPVTANQNAKLALIAYVRNVMQDYAAQQAIATVTAPAAGLIS